MKISKKDTITFIIIFVYTLIIFHGFLTMHYATDTYRMAKVGYTTYALNWSLTDGRVFMCIIGLVADFFNIPINVYVISLLIISLFISCAIVIMLKNIILRYRPAKNKYQEVFVLVISYFTIFNFMYLENMSFVECAVMAIALLLYILSAKKLVDRNKNHILKSSILFVLAVFSYQGSVGIFFAMTVLFSTIKNENKIKEIFKDLFKAIGIASIGILLNIFQVQITNMLFNRVQTRIGGLKNIPYNIILVLYNMPNILIGNCGYFPKWLFIVFILSTVFFVLWYIMKNKESKQFDGLLMTITTTIISSFVIFTITLTAFSTGRMHFCIGALLGIIFIFLYCNTNIFDTKFKYVLITIFSLYAIITIFVCIYIMYEHKIVNGIDIAEVKKIEEHINNYERKNNIKIENVHIYVMTEKIYKAFYTDTVFKNTITESALKVDWSIGGIIYFYTGRKLNEEIELLEEEKLEENYKLLGNTLYINAYDH